MNKEKILYIIKKYSLLLFYVIWYLPFFLFFRYYDTMDLLEKMGVNGKIFDMLVYLFLPFFFILYFLTPKLWKYFGQFAGRKIFFTLLILSFIIPVNQFSRVMYLKHFIKTYESAVSYMLEKDYGWDYQLIKLPSQYDVIFRLPGSDLFPNYAYFMRDDNSIKIFFDKKGLIKNKGYLYTIDYSNKERPMSAYIWGFVNSDYETQNGGYWTWEEFYDDDLPNYNDKTWGYGVLPNRPPR